MFKRFKVTGINENPKKPKRNWLKYLAIGCVVALPAFALLKTGVLSMNKNVLAVDQNKYDIVADLDGGKFEMDTTPEFTKMDNGNWLYKYKPVPTSIKLPVPVKDGYDFTGWTVSAKPDIQKEYSIPAWHKGNLNVKANWEPVEANLTLGSNFNSKIKAIDGIENVKTVIFDKMWDANKGVDVSKLNNSVVKAWISGDTLHISSLKDVIYLNADSSQMFRDLKTIVKIDFGILDSSRLMVMNDMFSGCSSLTTGDFNSLNVSKVSDLSNVFNGCSSLHNINLSNWNTSNVTSMQQIFSGCSSLTSVDLSAWNTVKLVNMNGMFSQCSDITRINLSNFNTSSVTSMANMFNGCTVISSLDLTGLDMSAVTDFSAMFKGCNFLESLKANFDLVDVQNTSEMFMKCNNLKLNFTVNSTVQNYDNMFKSCSNLSGKVLVNYVSPETKEVARKMVLTKGKGDNVYLHEEPTTLVNGVEFNKRIKGLSRFRDVTKIEFITKEIVSEGVDVSENNDGSIKAYVEGTTLYVASPAPVYANPDCSEMFNFRISHGGSWDVNAGVSDPFGNAGGGIPQVRSLFVRAKAFFMNLFAIRPDYALGGSYYAIKVISLDNFDTSNVMNMENMFRGCGGLVQIPVNELKTDKVTNMSGAFSYCESITDLDLSKLKTSVLQNIDGIFKGCAKLTNLNMADLNTSKVTSLESVFEDCAQLNQIDISSWDISNVNNTTRLFAGCSKLSGNLTITDEKITTYDYMFSDCSTDKNAKFIVKYRDNKAKELGRKMVETKNENDHIYLDGEEPAFLVPGWKFSDMLRHNTNVRFVNFKYGIPDINGTDVSVAGDKSIMATIHGDTIDVVSNKKIFANPDCSGMFDTSELTANPVQLEMINFDNFDTRNVVDMSYMFGCRDYDYDESYSEPTVTCIKGLENFNLENVKNMNYMFSRCFSLSGEIIISNPNISSYTGMFEGCSFRKGSKFIVKYKDEATKELARKMVATKSTGNHVYLDGEAPTAILPDGRTFNSTIKGMAGFSNVKEIRFVKGTPVGTDVSLNKDGSVKANINGTVLTVASNDVIYANKDCDEMFGDFTGITNIIFDNLDTSETVSMDWMFGGCSSLTSLDLSNFVTSSNLWSTRGMFNSCKNLTFLDISKLNFSSVHKTEWMFGRCSNLKNLDLSNFDTTSMEETGGMFYGCSKLTAELTIRNYAAMVYDSGDYGMFEGCSSDPNAKFIVKYVSEETKNLAKRMVATKNPGDHVYLDGDSEKAVLINGTAFHKKVSALPGYNNVIRVEFNRVEALPNNHNYVNVSNTISEIQAYVEGNTLKVVSTKQIYANSDSSEMFATANDKTTPYAEIVFNNFDTSKVKWLYGMFANCKNLTSVDVSGFNTSNVTDMGLVFMNCPKLTTLDISKWDMSKAVRTLGMFKGCSGLTTLIHGPLITAANTNPAQMFAECSSLTSVNTNGWDVSSVTDMYGMFYKCSSLISVDVSTWDVSKVTNMELMFGKCAQLNQLDVANWRPASVTTTGGMFDSCSSLTVLDVTDWVTSSLQDASGMFWGCAKVKTLDVTYWDTACLENTASMFRDCAAVTELNIGGWNTNALTNAGVMFNGCKSITKLDVENWNVSGVTNMNSMFRECDNLISLDLSKWDVSKVKNMANMFSLDYKLETLNVSNWDTSSLEKMEQMFLECYKLQSLDLSSWNTSKVTGLFDLFFDCNEITSIKFGSGWDTSNVTNMKGMFYRCLKLKELDLSMFNTSKVTNFNAMFAQDRELRTINSIFDLVSATDVSIMFANNNRLVGSIKVSNPDIPVYKNMFFDCSCLDSSRFDVYYASNAQSMAQRLVNTKTDSDNVVLAGVRSVADESANPEPTELSPQQESANQDSVGTTSKTVTITLNNGSMAMYPVQKIQILSGKIGDLAKPDLNPKYAGQFGGYFYDKNCTIPVKPNDVVTQDIELYAKW